MLASFFWTGKPRDESWELKASDGPLTAGVHIIEQPAATGSIMRTKMPHTRHFRPHNLLMFGVLAIACIPALANAQFEVNKLFGKKFGDVKKILGTPIETSGKPILFSRFKTSGAVDTIVWYFYNTGEVQRVQIYIPAKPGETAANARDVLKRYKLDIGPNPKVYVGTKLPSLAEVSQGKVPGMPWRHVYVNFKCAETWKPETMKYCKEHHLKPTDTFFWTVMVRNGDHWKKALHLKPD